MEFVNALKKRRTYYSINRSLPVSEEKIIETVQEVTEATPDAFNIEKRPCSHCYRPEAGCIVGYCIRCI